MLNCLGADIYNYKRAYAIITKQLNLQVPL